MIPLEEARQTVLAGCQRLPATRLPLDAALGCITAAPITSSEAVPPFANTAMDGYAVQAADTAEPGCRLEVVGTLPAGSAWDGPPLSAGQAIRIMTGAPMPEGADAIVPVEVTATIDATSNDEVEIQQAARVGDHVRPAGEDIAAGQEVFPTGTLLRPGHLGVLASIGLLEVDVYRRPRVGVLSTGDELVDRPEPLAPGQIRDSNRRTLLALGAESGFDAVDLGLAHDDPAEIEAVIDRGLDTCDALVTSGGVSMGDFDYVKAVLDQLSKGQMRWMQIAIRPAKPLAFGVIEGKPVFGLPGNPVSSMVSFELFARPGLRQLAGWPPDQLDRPSIAAIAAEPMRRRPDGKIHFNRVVATIGPDGRYRVRSSGGQASNLLRSMALANALAVLPDGDGVEQGDDIAVLLLH